MDKFVSVENMTKNYAEVCAVDNLSFSVNKGEIYGLLGPNGAGKSTTLSVITTLTDFNKGNITIGGFDIKKDTNKIKRIIGIVPQDIAVYDHLSAIENVKFFASLYGIRGGELTAKATEALEFVGLSDKHNLRPKKMSGGMKRRLNIACGIAHAPQLIVMDEPTVGVDTQSREHILQSIKTLKERGATVIYTSHYMQEVTEICDRIAIIDKGKMVACGTEQELVSMVTDIRSLYITTKFNSKFDIEMFQKNLSLMPEVKNVTIEENVIKIDVSIKFCGVNNLIDSIIKSGLEIHNVNSEMPTLDTTFLTLTGRGLR